MMSAPTCALVTVAKAASISSRLRTGCDDSRRLSPGARAFISWRLLAPQRLAGFQMMPTLEALGTVSLTSWSHFPLKLSPTAKESPVILPPGRARLWTNPEPTGSPDTVTMGVVVVLRLAAAVAAVPCARRISTLRSISSPMREANRSSLPSA